MANYDLCYETRKKLLRLRHSSTFYIPLGCTKMYKDLEQDLNFHEPWNEISTHT